MELRQLQCLVACAQTRSFSKAAATLYTTQSNVSKTIASLENELGALLFERKQHGIELTNKGSRVYKHALNMMEYSTKIINCVEEDTQELRICFRPSSWFAAAFCDYYLQCDREGKRFYLTSASLEEIIRRLVNDLDQMGYAYMEEDNLEQLQEVFKANHIVSYVLEETCARLYCGALSPKSEENGSRILPLIQGLDDPVLTGNGWKKRKEEEKEGIRHRVVVKTNSDYIMQEMLKRTELCNISPRYLSHTDREIRHRSVSSAPYEKKILFVCLFRNDRPMEGMAKSFFNYIKKYLKE